MTQAHFSKEKRTAKTIDYLDIIFETIRVMMQPEKKEIIKQAYEKSGLGSDLTFKYYRQLHTWKDGVQHREDELSFDFF